MTARPRISSGRVIGDRHFGKPLIDLFVAATGLRQSRHIPFDISHEHRGADIRKTFAHRLDGHGLAGAGRSANEPMPIRQSW